MKAFTLLILAAFSVPSFAMTYSCQSAEITDSYKRITLNQDGTLEMQNYEFQTTLSADQVSQVTSIETSAGLPSTHLTIVKDAVAKYTVEGDEGEGVVTLVFSYNPAQKAGRLTYLQDGRTMARNLLLKNCTQN